MRVLKGLSFQSMCKMNMKRSCPSSLLCSVPPANIHQSLIKSPFCNETPTNCWIIFRRKHAGVLQKPTLISYIPIGKPCYPLIDSQKLLLPKKCQHYVHDFNFRCLSAGTGSEQSVRRQKPSKPAIKEFTVKGKISEHDLNVKFVKIKHLLEKGKAVHVFLKPLNSAKSKSSIPVNEFEQKLKENVSALAKVHQDYSNEYATRFSLSPVIKKETGKLDEDKGITQ